MPRHVIIGICYVCMKAAEETYERMASGACSVCDAEGIIFLPYAPPKTKEEPLLYTLHISEGPPPQFQ